MFNMHIPAYYVNAHVDVDAGMNVRASVYIQASSPDLLEIH